ncbi:MAG: amidohydrolase family protein [Saprospiraceae bacterium]|nr:amidohydrolase family protein [Saprospiraceae bacterium]
MKLLTINFILCFAFFSISNAQQITKATTGIFLLKNGNVYTHDNGVIKADVLLQDGEIKEVAEMIEHPGAKKFDCKGMTIYPGMIDSGTKIGLGEVGAVSLTQDHNEIGEFTPHMEALTAVNPNSVNIPVNRVNGITTALTVPSGGRFPGTAALINLNGYTPEEMYANFKGVVFNFPSSGKRGRWDRRSDEKIKKDEEKARKKINDFWEKAKLYAKIHSSAKRSDLDYNPQLHALMPAVNKTAPLLIEVNKKSDILSAIKWVNKNDIKAIFTGVSEGYLVTDSLVKYNIPIITGPILNNPSRASDHYNTAYSNAGKMQKAGLIVAIRTNETENVRNLPYNAGFAAAYGMGTEEAFKAVTINPAKIFGISDKYGSIERGKVANIFVADGDPFETKTKIKFLFINGYNVPLESRHTYLYDEFLER